MGKRVIVGEQAGQRGPSLMEGLTAPGVSVETAQRTLGLLQACRRDPPDLLVLDGALPSHSPPVVCRILRTQAQTSGVPIVVVVPPEDRHVGDLCLEAGANRVLERPVDPDALESLVRSLLGLDGGAAGARGGDP